MIQNNFFERTIRQLNATTPSEYRMKVENGILMWRESKIPSIVDTQGVRNRLIELINPNQKYCVLFDLSNITLRPPVEVRYLMKTIFNDYEENFEHVCFIIAADSPLRFTAKMIMIDCSSSYSFHVWLEDAKQRIERITRS
ncbi:MAG: hypothetical protein ABJF11_10885 [Reichenbachiella sp.]|uniref:hypothetical protein n=1 Tax=Reichenbachiella sp. TaxID=2184521 RepID=UPI003265BD28